MSSGTATSLSTVHHSPEPLTPRRTLRQEAYQTLPNSAPSSPVRHAHRIKAGYGYPSQPQPDKIDKTFLGHATSGDSMRDQDDGDPHDLSFPTKHFPRASMVDNLVMSLDRFSPTNDTSRNHAPRTTATRQRGHFKSSSITVETEIKGHNIRDIPVVEIHTVKEGVRLQQTEQVPVVQGEEDESQRERVYNAQRAMTTGKPVTHRANTKVKTRSDSNSSSIDLGHLSAYAGRLGPAGNRRSQSFDYGSTRPKPTADLVESTTLQNISRGLESTSSSIPHASPKQDSKVNHNRKGRSGTVGAGNARTRLDSPQSHKSNKNPPFDMTDNKSIPPTPAEPAPLPRAGFFRRVFGSSNRSSANTTSHSSPSRISQDRTGSALDDHRPSTPPIKTSKSVLTESSQNKENQPAVAKKPSSFFRRRKKSTSGGVPPPLPLTLDGSLNVTKAEGGAASPVSSLRAFMDPYLGDAPPKHGRGSSLQSVQHIDDVGRMNTPVEPADPARLEKPFSADFDMLALADTNSRESPKALPSTKTPSSVNKSDPAKSPSSQASTPKIDLSQTKKSAPVLNGQPKKDNYSPSKHRSVNAQVEPDVPAVLKTIKLVPQSSGSDTSDYKSAPSTPLVAEVPDRKVSKSPAVHVSHPSMSLPPASVDIEQARKIYDNSDEQITPSNASSWLGEAGSERERVRLAYMNMFDWTNHTILSALRNLCSKLVLKGETQQVDRVLDSFARRWCECNVNHGFKSADIVHTICYSVLLLNTDLHLADIGRKMTKAEFVRNAIEAIRENVPGPEIARNESTNHLSVGAQHRAGTGTAQRRPSIDRSASSLSNTRTDLSREESHEENVTGPLVEAPFQGSQSGWETQVESVLKDFYSSIARDPLPLFGFESTPQQSSNNLSTFSNLRRTPSTVSRATSENRIRYAGESRSLGARWASKTRSRPRLGTTQGFGSSRTSIDDQSSAWSPSMSSTWSKASLGKTLTSMSVDSFGTDHVSGGYQSSIGFANALSQAITRDEQTDGHVDDGMKATPLLEDDSLELYGAPWAKEGILKHKCHLEGVEKRSKDRNWNDCFAVIEKGWMRLFSFSMTAKSLRNKARNQKAGAVVGGGNWQDNAEEVWKFMLRHTIASSLPPPGYSKQRPYVWALSLPNGAVHLFSVGTPDIAKEFVSTANFWSARLSKEPMTGGISSEEYGWSDNVINRALIASDSRGGYHPGSPRPSTQMSMRSSIDHGSFRPRLHGDRVHISEWVSPQQSLMASQLLEVDQLKALQVHVQNVETELSKHNELRGPMLLAFSARHPNSQKAMTNWEKKSAYLLREIVKFRTYIDALQSARSTKQKVDKMKLEEELGRKMDAKLKQDAVVATGKDN